MNVLWGSRGGVGVTSLVCATAALIQRRNDKALVVDLCGDAVHFFEGNEAAFDLSPCLEPYGPSAEVLMSSKRERQPVVPVLDLSNPPRRIEPDRIEGLVEVLFATAAEVLVDAGALLRWSPADVRRQLVDLVCDRAPEAPVGVLGCDYVGTRAARRVAVPTKRHVIVREPERSLGYGDVANALGLTRYLPLQHDSRVGRTVDAGLLASRTLRGLRAAAHYVLDEEPGVGLSSEWVGDERIA